MSSTSIQVLAFPIVWLLGVAPLLSQTVRVVDPLGGGQYLTVTEAIAASDSGDTILIRNGGVVGEDVRFGIPLRIVSEGPRAFFLGLDCRFTVRPALPVVVAGVDIYFGTIVGAANVVLEDFSARHLGVHDTASLLFVDSTATGFGIPFPGPSLDLHDSNAAVVSSTIGGWSYEPAIGIVNGSLLVANSNLTGGHGSATRAPGPAIRGERAQVALTSSTLTGGPNGPQVAVELDDASTLVVDPSVRLAGTTPPIQEKRMLPHLDGAGVAAGLAASVELQGPPQTFAFLAVADQATAPVESALGSLWLDPTGFLATVMTGITDNAGRMTFAYTMPPLVAGTPLYFQGLVLPASAPPALTAPLAVVVR